MALCRAGQQHTGAASGALERSRHRSDDSKAQGVAFELCPPAELIRRQDALVRELEPRCNRRMD